MSDYCLGIEIGGTKIQFCLGNPAGEITKSWRFEVPDKTDGNSLFQKISNKAQEIVNNHACRAVGVGFGGPVDGGVVKRSFQIPGWEGFPLSNNLEAALGLPVFVENDANLAALAEYHNAKEASAARLFYLTIGSGLGGGFIIDGKIYRGHGGIGAEIGHMPVEYTGATLESRCSGWALDREIRKHISDYPDSSLRRYLQSDEPVTARLLEAALSAGDLEAQRIAGIWSYRMGYALTQMICLLHPGVIVLGGGVSLLGEPLMARVRSEIRSRINEEDLFAMPEIRQATLGEQVVPVGAIRFAFNEQTN